MTGAGSRDMVWEPVGDFFIKFPNDCTEKTGEEWALDMALGSRLGTCVIKSLPWYF